MTDWLTDHNDWLKTELLTEWLTEYRLTDWPTALLTENRMTDLLNTEWLIDGLSEWVVD